MPDGETADKLKLVRIQGSADTYNEAGTKHTGVVVVDENKLYEFSGYIKADNTNPLPENACGSLAYLSGSGSSATDLKNYKATPWVGKTGDQNWTKFNVAPVVMNWPSVKMYALRPGFEALTAALHLEGRRERIDELFFVAYKDKIDDLKERHDIK